MSRSRLRRARSVARSRRPRTSRQRSPLVPAYGRGQPVLEGSTHGVGDPANSADIELNKLKGRYVPRSTRRPGKCRRGCSIAASLIRLKVAGSGSGGTSGMASEPGQRLWGTGERFAMTAINPAAAESSAGRSRGGTTDDDPAISLLRLANGYQISQAISVAAMLNLADQIGPEPRTATDIAEAVGADPAALYHLLRALQQSRSFVRPTTAASLRPRCLSFCVPIIPVP